MKGLHMIAYILLIVGGLNWGLEFFGWGIGRFLSAGVANIVYLLVGIAAVVEMLTHKSSCKHCEPKSPMQTM